MATATAPSVEALPPPDRRPRRPPPGRGDNRYTRWFAEGDATRGEVRHLTVQFSVFSHLFVEAQLRKVINAADLDTYRAGKEILLNELGVVFNAGARRRRRPAPTPTSSPPRAPSTAGASASAPPTSSGCCASRRRSASGSTSSASAATAPPPTLFFCDELLEVYGSEDASTAEGASYAVEHWAAAGFWKELIAGLEAFKARECAEPAAGVLDLARQGRGPARRPHRRRAGGGVRPAVVRRGALPRRRRPDARRRAGVLGRAVGRPRGGGRAMSTSRSPSGPDPRRHRPPRVVGGQRPRLRRVPRRRLRLRPRRLRRPRDRSPRPRAATCSSRAGCASWCRARCTPTARSPSTSAPTATASATSASSSTTSPAAYDAALARGAALAARAGQGRGRRRRRSTTPPSAPTATPCTRSSTARPTRARSPRSSSPPTSCGPVGPEVGHHPVRPRRRQRRAGPPRRVGRLLRAGARASTSSPTSTTSRSPPSTRR